MTVRGKRDKVGGRRSVRQAKENTRSFFEARPWVAALLLGLATAIVFRPAIFNQFVNYDDPDYLTRNTVVQRGLTWEGIRWALTTGHACNWHPLTWLSHMLDCQLFGMEAWGHHLTSVLIHSFSTALLFLVLLRFAGDFWPSIVTAAVFGLHPTRVESVAWASERKDVLSTLFWLLTMWAYAKWAREHRRGWFWLCLFFFALGLLSKPMLVTLPFVLLLLDFWPLRRFSHETTRTLLIEKVPMLAMALASCAITLAVQQDAMSSLEKVPFVARIANSLMAYARYIGQLFWPAKLAVFYPRREHWEWQWIVLAVLLLTSASWTSPLSRSCEPRLL